MLRLEEARASHHAETGKEDATEHHDGTAAQYSLRNRSKYITDSWEDTTDNHDNGTQAK